MKFSIQQKYRTIQFNSRKLFVTADILCYAVAANKKVIDGEFVMTRFTSQENKHIFSEYHIYLEKRQSLVYP